MLTFSRKTNVERKASQSALKQRNFRPMNCDVATHDGKLVPNNFKFSAKISMTHQNVWQITFKIINFKVLSKMGRRRELIRFQAQFKKKLITSRKRDFFWISLFTVK